MSQGKYQGKRLSATEVIRLYAAGERDFRGAVLRGCNFRGADLSGVDFSGADIRSAQFVEATLRGVNFSHARAGLQRRWILCQFLLMLALIFLSYHIASYSGKSLDFWVSSRSSLDRIFAFFGLFLIITTVLSLVSYGISKKFLIVLLTVFSISVLVGTLGTSSGSFIWTPALSNDPLPLRTTDEFINSASSITGSIFSILIIAFSTLTLMDLLGRTYASAVFGFSLSSLIIQIFYSLSSSEGISESFFSAIIIISGLLLGGYFHFYAICNRPYYFRFLKEAFVLLSSIGGASFRDANLVEAIFTQASLKGTTFSENRKNFSTLARIRWSSAQQLDRARLGTTNLQDPRVRLLLTTLNGIDQDLSNADLRGANLAGAKLHRANLTGANLSGALLHHAELQGAILTEANCVGTDFTAAQLTGACLEAWNIDSTTVLKDIDCQYVFLREQPDARGSRECRPHDPDKTFQPGDFEKFFREMLDTVQILIRNGVDPQAFRTAFEKVMAEYPSISRNSIQGMEKQGSDVLLTLQVPEGTDKGKLERTWDEGYQLGLKEGYTSGLLEGQKQRADDVKEVALSFSRFFSPIHINNMNNPINTGDGSFYAGGDVNLSGSTLNLGQISGQVTNQINQIPAPATPDQPNLRDILTQLKTAAETDGELSDDEKAEALQAVSRIATAATDPAPSAKTQGLVKRASVTLKGMTETLTDASKLADACTKLLPLVLSLFALV